MGCWKEEENDMTESLAKIGKNGRTVIRNLCVGF